MKYNPRKVDTRTKISRGIINFHMDKLERRKNREAYNQMAEQKRNDPDNIRYHSAQEISQDFSVVKAEVCDFLKSKISEIKTDIFEIVKSELNIQSLEKNCFYDKNLSFAKMEELIQIFLPVLKRLKEMSESHYLLNQQYGSAYTTYERLFNELIETDARFALFAPSRCLNRSIVMKKVETLPDCAKLSILNKKEELEKGEQDYVSEHEICEFDPQDIRVQKANAVNLKLQETQNVACKRIAIAIVEMGDDLFNFIRSELKLNPINPPVLKHGDIKKILESCSNTKSNLERLSNNPLVSEVAGWKDNNPYNTMFYNLINSDPKFVFYAPVEVLRRTDLNFDKLSDKEKDLLFAICKSKNLFDDDEFYKQYHKVFDDQFNKDAITF